MGEHDTQLDVTAEREAKRELQEALGRWLGTDVRVQSYAHAGKLDVKVDLPGMKAYLEETYPDVSVAPYSDFKLTIVERD